MAAPEERYGRETMTRTILHVDMDAFFAAVEQLRRPELRGKPVVVGGSGNPHSRGVVSTASYEARAYGIHSAMPLRTAFNKCPHAVFLPVDFFAYGAASRQIMAILREYSPLVEPLSLDEAFLDVSSRPEVPRALAEEIRRRIKDDTGLTASIGIGPNKLLAKIASGLHKPDAVTEITPDTTTAVLHDLPATVLWGVGPKTAARLEQTLGVRTVGDLQDEGYRGRTVTVKIRYRDFRTHTRALTLPEPINDGDAIRQTAVALLDRFALDRPVRLVGVRVSGLTKAGNAETGKRENAEQRLAKDDS